MREKHFLKIKTSIFLLLAVALLAALLTGCGQTHNTQEFSLESLSGKKVGVTTGSVFDLMLLKQVPDAVPEYINAYTDLAIALDSGKIEAYVADQPVARLLCSKYKNQTISYQLEDASYAFMFAKGDIKHDILHSEFNDFLAKCRKDGTISEIDSIWFGGDASLQTVDFGGLSGERGVLEMAVSSDVGAPFAYVQNGQMVGYDVDLAVRFCREYGYGLNISDYSFPGLLAAVTAGKADMAASSLVVTPERQETSLMSDPDYIGGIVVVTRTEDEVIEKTPFFTSLWESFERSFLRENRWQMFLAGLGTTFLITILSMAAGTIGGFLIYRIIHRGNKVFNKIWAAFAGIMEKTPVVVLLMILYYIVFGRSNLSNVWVSIIGFTALFTCTVSNLLEMGAEAISVGQEEAALALGYSERQTYLRIIFPQSIKHFLPAYKSEAVSLVKATAVVGYIAVQDLTKISDVIRSRTYEAFFPLVISAIIYILVAVVIIKVIKNLEIKIDPRNRKEEDVLKGIKR